MRISRKAQALVVCSAVVVSATGFAALPQQNERAMRVAPVGRSPIAVIEGDFASLRESPDHPAASAEPRVRLSCNDFEFSFLSPTCSKTHRKHVRHPHGVETFVMGRRDGSTDAQPGGGEAGRKIE